jgi:glycosyltransferase involved in cell wall biosynthesis
LALVPSPREVKLYIKSGKTRLYTFGTASLFLLITGMILFIRGNPETSFVFGIFSSVTIFYLLVSYFIGVFGKEFDSKEHFKKVALFNPESLPETERPTIDIFYPTCGEDANLQIKVLDNIIDLQKRWGVNCKIYCLDDSKNNTGYDAFTSVRHRTKNIFYISREDKGVLKKAGNLRNAFKVTSGKYIAVFDADFSPHPSFFEQTVPYLETDNKIGILQTPQYFNTSEGVNWIQKGASYVQELFYRLIQVNRNSFDASICVGTCAVYRRDALSPFGGPADIPYSEDVRTGFRLLSIGYLTKYIPLNLTKGLCPDTVPAYFIQQHRWALGSIDLFLSKEFWKVKMSTMQRLCYLSGMLYYITTGLGVFFVYFPSLYLLIFKPDMILLFNAIFSVPSFIFGTIYMAYWTKAPWGVYSMKARIVSYHAHLFALVERLTNTITPWQATGVATKTKVYTKFQKLMFWKITIITFVTLICVFSHYESYGIINFIPTLFFCLLNYYLYVSILRDQI